MQNLAQCFLSFSEHGNHLGTCLQCRFGSSSGKGLGFCISNKFLAMLMLLVRGPHLE